MRIVGRRWMWTAAGVVAIAGASITAVHGQRLWSGYYGRTPPKFATPETFEGSFHFCRVMFTSDRREKQEGFHRLPRRRSQLQHPTRRVDQGPRQDDPRRPGRRRGGTDAVVVRLTDDELFECAFIFMEDAGTAHFTDTEVARLRQDSLKGGFLLVSDYHGVLAQQQFDEEIGRVLPRHEYPLVNLAPPDHPIWRTMFQVKSLPQLASINTWRRTGGRIERWNGEGAPPDAGGIADAHGRLMVVMIHNTDIPDAWEREAEDPEYFFTFSPESYTPSASTSSSTRCRTEAVQVRCWVKRSGAGRQAPSAVP